MSKLRFHIYLFFILYTEAIHNMTPIFDGVYVYCFDDSSITDDDSAIAAMYVW